MLIRPHGRRRTGLQAGFTLLEVLGAAVIMAFGLLALVNVMNFTYRMQVLALGRSSEWTVMQAKMDELLGLPFSHFDESCNPIPFGGTCNGTANQTIGGLLTQAHPDDDWGYGDWTGSITVENLDSAGQAGGDGKILRRLLVNIRQSGGGGATNFSDTFALVIVDTEDMVP